MGLTKLANDLGLPNPKFDERFRPDSEESEPMNLLEVYEDSKFFLISNILSVGSNLRRLLSKQQKNTERHRLVRKALIINLAKIHELSDGTIAKELQVSVKTVKQVIKDYKDEALIE